MKKQFVRIVFLLVLSFIFSLSQAQETPSIGITFAPFKNAVGVVYEEPSFFNERLSIVLSMDNGTYKYEDFFGASQVSVMKMGGGLKYDWFTVLYLHNTLHKIHNPINHFNLENVHKNSIEIGGIGPITHKWKIIMLYDILNYEARFGVAYKL